MSYDDVTALAGFARRHSIELTLLADADSAIIRAFGMLNGAYSKGSAGYGLARPAIFVIGAKGVVTHRFAEADYTVRPDIQTVFDGLRK